MHSSDIRSTLALGSPESAFYRSLHTTLFAFGKLEFRHEQSFTPPESIVEYVVRSKHDAVLMPNPYGNPIRLSCYRALRDAGIQTIASDRGALPDSWFFDVGFNADSPSYAESAWDYPMSALDRQEVESYVRKLRSSSEALEAQGKRQSSLRERLSLEDTKILFVPLQRPNDTVIRYFAGAARDMPTFLSMIDDLAERLYEESGGQWKVLLKKHPLENDYPIPASAHVKYVGDDVHIHDLLDLADVVACVNSGVGLLSLMFAKPTLVLGDAFYSATGLATSVSTPESFYRAILGAMPPDPERVLRFVAHLKNRVYSFARSKTELRRDPAGGMQRITREMNFYDLKVLGNKVPLPDRSIVIVSPVIPFPIYRGSQTRVDMVIRGLLELGYRVSLCVLNTSFRDKTSKQITHDLRHRYPGLDRIVVRRSPGFDPRFRGRVASLANRMLNAVGQQSWIHNRETCPPSFRRAVAAVCREVEPDLLLVNYAKMAPSVPRTFKGQTVLDTHDYQTAFLREDQSVNHSRRNVVAPLYAFSERAALRRFDTLLAINPNEADVFRQLAPRSEVAYVPAFTERRAPRGIFQGHRFDAVFVGSMSNFNVSGLDWFLTEVLARIVDTHQDFRLGVVGNIVRTSKKPEWRAKSIPGVDFLGIVDDLSAIYEQSKIVIAPILGGAGMKIKVIEALGHGKAIVATPKAVEGIALTPNRDAAVSATPADFATSVCKLLADPASRSAMEAAALQFHDDHHSEAAVKTALQKALAGRSVS